jgi:hypothetical protein
MRGRAVGVRTLKRAKLVILTVANRWGTACSYALQPLRERSVEIFERHDVVAVCEARPTHNQSGFFFTSAAAADGFGACSFFKRVKLLHTFSIYPYISCMRVLSISKKVACVTFSYPYSFKPERNCEVITIESGVQTSAQVHILIVRIIIQCLPDLSRHGRGGRGEPDERAGVAVAGDVERLACRPVGNCAVEGPVADEPIEAKDCPRGGRKTERRCGEYGD